MKLPRNLSGLNFIKVLTKWYGWEVHRREGSHITLKKEGTRDLLTVYVNKPLTQGALLSTLRKANIEKEDFIAKL